MAESSLNFLSPLDLSLAIVSCLKLISDSEWIPVRFKVLTLRVSRPVKMIKTFSEVTTVGHDKMASDVDRHRHSPPDPTQHLTILFQHRTRLAPHPHPPPRSPPLFSRPPQSPLSTRPNYHQRMFRRLYPRFSSFLI
jgi:hypothetical protein